MNIDNISKSLNQTIDDKISDNIKLGETLNDLEYEGVEESILTTLNNKQNKSDNSLATTDKTIVGAINELFQNVDSGKQLIADAIGEPVSAEDTFSAMSSDINDLLSTFKTNMMNNGITVESGDKFKSLIDKIATMVEDGSGKGIQFAEGSYEGGLVSVNGTDATITTIDLNLEFQPTYIFVECYPFSIPYVGVNNFRGFCTNDVDFTITDNSSRKLTIQVNELTKEYVKLKTTITGIQSTSSNTIRMNRWYAIGVGEEDTTLRDSLADILENKGVGVTEEDDMASLITKVDNLSGGLDIISAANLPATGKDNQVCIISNNPDKNIILTPNSSEAITDTSFVVISSGSGTAISVFDGNLTTYYYISEIRDNVNLLSSYYWSNNEWKKLTGAMTVFLKNGTFYNDSIHGGLTSGSRASYTAGTGILLRSYYYSEDVWSYMFTYATLNTQINLSLYNKIELDLQLESAAPNYNTNFNLYKSSMVTNKEYSQSNGTPSGMTLIQGISITLKPNEITTISFDLTDHNDATYLCFNHIIGYNVFIKGIRLYHN